jgi:1-hydroxy-2-naphthoate dioxygenase
MSGEASKGLARFDQELAEAAMKGQWEFDRLLEGLVGGPRPAGVPHLWRWKDVNAKLLEACDVLPESFTARRNLAFMNPGLDRGTSHTMVMGMQMLKPGEIAWSHRHTMAAIRFVVDGSPDLVTVVDGERLPMEDNDLVLTPRWTWHDHHNGTDGNVTWLDALDIGLVLALNGGFYETLGERRQPEHERSGSTLANRSGDVRPTWERRKELHVPHRYPWRDVEPILLGMAAEDGSPFDGIVLEYVNPITGGHTMPTISCWIQMLRPGERTRPHRQTSSGMYHVVRGAGTTTVDGVDLEWTDRDCFVIPNWAEHSFVNRSTTEEAILFSVHDIPTLEALGLYYETPEPSLGVAPWPAVPADVTRPR